MPLASFANQMIETDTGEKLESPQKDNPTPLSIPLIVETCTDSCGPQPFTIGLPMPRGVLKDPQALGLFDRANQPQPLQTEILHRWSDGSVQWLLLDTVLGQMNKGTTGFILRSNANSIKQPLFSAIQLEETKEGFVVRTGVAEFHLNRNTFPPLTQVVIGGKKLLAPGGTNTKLIDPKGRLGKPRVEKVQCETSGLVRATIRYEGKFTGRVPCRFVARCHFFAGTGLMRINFTLHNPNRAKHSGGLWDLGDKGSMFFKDLSLEVELQGNSSPQITWRTHPGQTPQVQNNGNLEIYQDSSGGENWKSKNHLNRHLKVPCKFKGFRVCNSGKEEFGERANPVVSLETESGCLTVALPEFWQQFPKAIEAQGNSVRVGLFPKQFNDEFELQGGEKKTHTLWLQFGPSQNIPSSILKWVHQPDRMLAKPDWYASCGVFPALENLEKSTEACLDELFAATLEGEKSFISGRERIDEYGWRHYGEIYADHEGEYYEGPPPVISHYNNQYDQINGAILQHLRTGDQRWVEFFEPLARHVMDIDIYHTKKDKAAYNGGLFWFTDHYKSAETCTHRTYSRANNPSDNRPYGGGPSSNHLFTTGLLHFYFLTGDDNAREAVLTLANWVIDMEDGRKTILGLVDDDSTGLASATGSLDYHGPGRGGGNSVNALIDGWLISGKRLYLDKAEGLIRRCIHPKDDIGSRYLLNVEKRWSYTVFLSVLVRYLDIKVEHGELDYMFTYAQASLIHYAAWMLKNEVPYFDRREQMEFPTEAWACQEFRKANVMRLAAGHCDEPLRSRLLERGNELADRAWKDLFEFESRMSARARALLMVEGLMDARLRNPPTNRVFRTPANYNFVEPRPFIPQKQRVISKLKTPGGCLRAMIRLANPFTWWKLIGCIRQQCTL